MIRRVSIDKFYEIATGESDAFYHLCMQLPEIIKKTMKTMESVAPKDTVVEELKTLAFKQNINDDDMAFTMAVYMLSFKGYNGF